MPEGNAAPIAVNAAAKKYGIPQSTLSRWANQGRIKVLIHPERRGQKMMVDEVSVIEAARHHRTYWRQVPQKKPLLPFRYCPYCGQVLTDHNKPTP